ncbi:hypothetical protein CAEBREN_17834 [Caenorhabditis brenneri]|uniref:GATA-type domain-containing protein n=1 Tax=Caenorhabditis brenneri TaxID=135651 RepID=G0PDI2_CAEBE|nr:hypothetical protein CAEBREN_17834 [Caenorhabditis brenneri]
MRNQDQNPGTDSDPKCRRYQLISELLLSYARREDKETDEMDHMLVRALDEYTKMKQSNNTYQYTTTLDQPVKEDMRSQFGPSNPSNECLEDLLDPTISPANFLSSQEISDFFESFDHFKGNEENVSPGASSGGVPPPLKECSVCFTNKTTKWRRGMYLEQLCHPYYMYEERHPGKKRPQFLIEMTFERITEVPKPPVKKIRAPPPPKQCSVCFKNECSTWRRGRNRERLCSNCYMYDIAHDGKKRPQELIETTYRRNTGAQYPYGAPVPLDLKRPCFKCGKKEVKRRNKCMKCYDADRWLEKLKKREENAKMSSLY